MKILHPNKKVYLPIKDLTNYYNDGFYSMIDSKEENKLNYFLEAFEDSRSAYKDRIYDTKLYPNLPFSINTSEWKERQRDIKIIEKFIKNKTNLNILDVGSWNGWLSNYLTIQKHHVVALSLFKNGFDGVKSHNKYKTNFVSIQMHTDEIFRIEAKFDLIIFNRNWAFVTDKQKVFNDATKLLAKNGIILFTGLPFYKNAIDIKNIIHIRNNKFIKKYKIPLFYKPSKGFFEYSDFSFFRKNNIKSASYQIIKNTIKLVFPKKVRLFYCSYQKNI